MCLNEMRCSTLLLKLLYYTVQLVQNDVNYVVTVMKLIVKCLGNTEHGKLLHF